MTSNAVAIYLRCKDAQKRQGREDADVQLLIPGGYADRKRLDGRRGPLGYAISEVEGGALCVFKADAVCAYLKTIVTPSTTKGDAPMP